MLSELKGSILRYPVTRQGLSVTQMRVLMERELGDLVEHEEDISRLR